MGDLTTTFPPKDLCWWHAERSVVTERLGKLEIACDELSETVAGTREAMAELRGDVRVVAVKVGALATVGAIVGSAAMAAFLRGIGV